MRCELEVTVDELFSLQTMGQASPQSLAAEILSAVPPEKGQPVRICPMGSRWVSVPVTASPYHMPEADGIVKPTRLWKALGLETWAAVATCADDVEFKASRQPRLRRLPRRSDGSRSPASVSLEVVEQARREAGQPGGLGPLHRAEVQQHAVVLGQIDASAETEVCPQPIGRADDSY